MTPLLSGDFATIKSTLTERDSQELQAIWIEHDNEAWTPEAFQAIAEILHERGEQLPQQGGELGACLRGQRLQHERP